MPPKSQAISITRLAGLTGNTAIECRRITVGILTDSSLFFLAPNPFGRKGGISAYTQQTHNKIAKHAKQHKLTNIKSTHDRPQFSEFSKPFIEPQANVLFLA